MLFDDAHLEDPYPRYARWRDSEPVWFDEENNAWVLSRFEDIRQVFKDPETFSSNADAPGSTLMLPLLMDDPPRHTKLRALVNRAFTSRALKDMEEGVAALAQAMVTGLDASRPIDIAEALTIPLPIRVIADLMGIPAERAADFKRWSDAVTLTTDMSEEDRMKDIMELFGFFQAMIPERRAAPGEDLVSRLVTAEVDGDVLSDEDIVGFAILLLIAGNETTTNLLSNLLHYLSTHPDDWERLRADRSLIDAAIEEILRFDAPVQYVDRKATRDVEFHGQVIKAGERVSVLMGSANRDENEYEHPDEFRLDRGRSHHHTFGHGIHFCIGAPLGRMEARYAMEALLERFASLRPAEVGNERTHSHMLRGFHHLWLQFDVAASAAA
ncbi:MAG: cytochrome P450 [Halieaceae bacterium]|nr:cytochrome P450 [Halieaceae bacterium]